MSVPDGFFERLLRSSLEVRRRLKADPKIGPYIDETLPILQPFGGRGASPIKLVIVGQDPTVGVYRTGQGETITRSSSVSTLRHGDNN